MALQTIAKGNKSANAASAHLPVASGRTIAKDSTATTEITMTAPADDERGGVLIGPEKTKLCAMFDWWSARGLLHCFVQIRPLSRAVG